MTEQPHSWQDVAITIIAALPAVIAAVSSLRNGRALKNGQGEHTRKAAKKKTPKDDWFKPPDLN